MELVLLEYSKATASHFVHTWFRDVHHNVVVDLGSDRQALVEAELKHDALVNGDDPKYLEIVRKIGVPYCVNLINVLIDPPVGLFVALKDLVEVLVIREEPEHSGGPMLELTEQGHCLELFQVLRDLCD